MGFKGTWQFTSAALLQCPELPASVADEIESLFHVVVYVGVSLICSTAGRHQNTFLTEFFDGFSLENGELKGGWRKIGAMCCGNIQVGIDPLTFLRHSMDFGYDHPLNEVVEKMMPIFKARYARLRKSRQLCAAQANQTGSVVPLASHLVQEAEKLDSHTYFKTVLSDVLRREDWPEPQADFISTQRIPERNEVDDEYAVFLTD